MQGIARLWRRVTPYRLNSMAQAHNQVTVSEDAARLCGRSTIDHLAVWNGDKLPVTQTRALSKEYRASLEQTLL